MEFQKELGFAWVKRYPCSAIQDWFWSKTLDNNNESWFMMIYQRKCRAEYHQHTDGVSNHLDWGRHLVKELRLRFKFLILIPDRFILIAHTVKILLHSFTNHQLVGHRCIQQCERTKGDFRGIWRCHPFPLQRFHPRQDLPNHRTALPPPEEQKIMGQSQCQLLLYLLHIMDWSLWSVKNPA